MPAGPRWAAHITNIATSFGLGVSGALSVNRRAWGTQRIFAAVDENRGFGGVERVGPEGVEPCKVDHRKYRAMPWRA
jgi:hypothetical protein